MSKVGAGETAPPSPWHGRLAWLMAVAGLMVLAVVAGMQQLSARLHEQAKNTAQETLRAVAALKADEVQRWVSDRIVLMHEPPASHMAISFSRLLEGRGRQAATAALQARFRHLHTINPEIKSIWLYDKAGTPIIGNGPQPQAQHAIHHPLAIAAMRTRRVQFLDLHRMGPTPEDVMIGFVAPLVPGDAEDAPAIGYALFELDPTLKLFPFVHHWPLPSASAETLLTRQEGKEIVFLNTLRHHDGPPLSLRLPLDSPGLISALSRREQKETVSGVDYRGEAVIGVVLPVTGTRWLLTAKMDESEVFAHARNSIAWIGGVSGAFILILLALGHSYLKQMRIQERADSEQRYRSLFENNHIAMLIIDPEDGHIVDANTAAGRYYGWPPQTLRSMRIMDINTLPAEEVSAEMARAQSAGRDYFLFRHRRADGAVRDVEVFSGPIRIGKRALLYSIVHDVSDRQRSNRRTQALLDISAIGGLLPEQDFLVRSLEHVERITDSGIAFMHFIHDDQETIELAVWSAATRRDCTARHHSHYPLSQAGIWADCFREMRPVVFNDYPRQAGKTGLPEGHAGLRRLISVPVIEEGRVRMIIGVGNKASDYDDTDVESVQLLCNDIWRIVRRDRAEKELSRNLSVQRQLNHQLEDAQNQILQSEKMASIGQLAAGVAHEINNPIGFVTSNLTTLQGYLEDILAIVDAYEAAEGAADPSLLARVRALKQEKDFDFLRADLAQLMAESTDGLGRVRKIVQDLKDFSRVGETNWQWVNIHQGLESTLNVVWNELKYKCTVKKHYAPDLPQIHCLPSQLNQVFMNLLVNAAHAIEPKDGQLGEIILSTRRRSADSIQVEVRDNGGGIEEAHLKRIFDPFFTTKPVGMGTGLGLSIAWGIVGKHKGHIDVSSRPGHGTTFTITLPIDPVPGENPP